jgi:hypothetical protein
MLGSKEEKVKILKRLEQGKVKIDTGVFGIYKMDDIEDHFDYLCETEKNKHGHGNLKFFQSYLHFP